VTYGEVNLGIEDKLCLKKLETGVATMSGRRTRVGKAVRLACRGHDWSAGNGEVVDGGIGGCDAWQNGRTRASARMWRVRDDGPLSRAELADGPPFPVPRLGFRSERLRRVGA